MHAPGNASAVVHGEASSGIGAAHPPAAVGLAQEFVNFLGGPAGKPLFVAAGIG